LQICQSTPSKKSKKSIYIAHRRETSNAPTPPVPNEKLSCCREHWNDVFIGEDLVKICPATAEQSRQKQKKTKKKHRKCRKT